MRFAIAAFRLLIVLGAAVSCVACAIVPRSTVKAGEFANQAKAEGLILTPILSMPTVKARGVNLLPESLLSVRQEGTELRPGDKLRLTLFEGGGADLSTSLQSGTAAVEARVQPDGTVTVPFAGAVTVTGYETAEIERAIVDKLAGKFVDAQVVVNILEQDRGRVTLVGASEPSLAAGDLRLLDALATFDLNAKLKRSATVVIARDGRSYSLPLSDALGEPSNNIVLVDEDTVHIEIISRFATVIGAVNARASVDISDGGLSVLDLLGEAGGLDDKLANPSVIFLIRTSAINAVNVADDTAAPTVMLVDMTSAADLSAASRFIVNDADVLYVPTAGYVDVQKILSSISGAASFATLAVR